MRRLFIYLAESKRLDVESAKLQCVQVDHCLSLGYRAEDIVIVSNIPFSYNGVTAINYQPLTFPKLRNHVKGWYVAELYKNGVVHGTYWLTDHDVFQVSHPDRGSPRGRLDVCTYGVDTSWRSPHPASEINFCGSFIGPNSIPFFEKLRKLAETSTDKRFWNEERAATYLASLEPDFLNLLDKRYNVFAGQNLKEQYALATKPVVAIHFHPCRASEAKMMCTDQNTLGITLAPPTLIYLLRHHRFSF